MSQRFAKINQLDPLRAVAAFMVMLQHYLPHYHIGHLPYGWVGVDLFFVISGFLITGILLQQKEAIQDRTLLVKNFIIKRALRLFPAYYLVVSFFAVLQATTGLWSWDKGEGIFYFTYTTNFLFYDKGFGSGQLNHVWSLAVEEQFYLIWPWLVLFLNGRTLSRLVLVLVLISFTMKCLIAEPALRMLTSSHFDTLGCGALLAYHRHRTSVIWIHVRSFAHRYAVVSIAGLATCALGYRTGILETASVLGFSVAVVAGAVRGYTGPLGKVLSMGWLVYLGKISYGLYLYHKLLPVPIDILSERFGIEIPGVVLVMVVTALTIITAHLSFILLERPFLRMKERFDL
ncbi:MAG TPA: acyltransferase [Flavobacteriales bacterium]|nr:acyltransferase [Flavobacteriales bacterium]